MTPYIFAQLLAWCDRSLDTQTPTLCCPRLVDGLWIACDGKALAWRRSDSPHDADPLLSQHLLGLQHRVADLEFHWPTTWRNLPVSSISPEVRLPCSSCRGTGLAASFIDVDATQPGYGLWQCDDCSGSGHTAGSMFVSLDCLPDDAAIDVDYLLRIGPLDRIAWCFNPLLRGGGQGVLLGETPNGMRFAVMPIVIPNRTFPRHVLATYPAKEL